MIRPYIEIISDKGQILLFGVGCAFLSSPGQTYFISLFLGDIASSLSLSAAELGSLYLIATLAAASLLPFTGHWLDRIDLRRYALFVLAGLAAACGVMGSAEDPISLLFAFLLLRLTGQGLMTHVAVTSIARHFDRRRGSALSLVAMGFPLAEGALPALVVVMTGLIGWRASYFAIGGVVLFVAAPLLIGLIWRQADFSRPPGWDSRAGPPRALDGLRIVVRTRFFWYALPILLFMPFSSTALVFHIHAIATTKGWTTQLVAFGFTSYAVGHAVGLLIAGSTVDRIGARAMLSLMDLPMIAGIAMLGLFGADIALLAFLGLVGFSSGLVQTTVGAVWAEVYGIAQLGTIRGFAIMLMVAGTALGPAAVGFAMDAGISVGGVSGALVAVGLAAALLVAIDARRARLRSK